MKKDNRRVRVREQVCPGVSSVKDCGGFWRGYFGYWFLEPAQQLVAVPMVAETFPITTYTSKNKINLTKIGSGTGLQHRSSKSHLCLTLWALWVWPPNTLAVLPSQLFWCPKGRPDTFKFKIVAWLLGCRQSSVKTYGSIFKWRVSWLLVCWTHVSAKITGIPAPGSAEPPSYFFLSQVSQLSFSMCFSVILISVSPCSPDQSR